MKKVYLYSDKNGEFLGEYNAHPDPETPGAYIEPVCSTDVAPPSPGNHQVAVFNGGVWTLVADYRGTIGYTESGEPVEIVNIGETLDSLGLLASPPVVVEPPSQCFRRQGRRALLQVGLLDDVEALLASIPDDFQRRAAQIDYEDDVWRRDNPTLQFMWAQLDGTPEGLDELFALAVTL